MPKVSVIIPVYNVEKYIEECLDSLINQTLKDIEIICVDDGSTDNTVEILNRYRQQDSRISVYYQKNKYAGVARNTGMQYATGKYVIFLDSDDFFDETMLEKTYEEAERCQAEVVLFSAYYYNNNTKEATPAPWLFVKDRLPSTLPFSPADTDGVLLTAMSPAPWTKLFLREYIEKLDLKFMPLQNSNDVFFTYVAVSCASRITYVDECLVYYRTGMTTSLQSTKKKNPLCFLEAYHASYHELKARGALADVAKGLRTAIVDGCLYNYNSVDEDTKLVIANSFMSSMFTDMDLLSGDEEAEVNPPSFYRIKALIKGYEWLFKLESLKTREDAVCIKSSRIAYRPKVSVIMPCYNVENYVEESIRSITGQTLQEIELICVNDGATDSTLEILLKLAEEDPRISVLTQENAGLSFTRNQGVKAASGKYIYFMDSDDILEADALEVLYSTAEEKELDVVYFDGTSFFETEELKEANLSYLTYYLRKNDYSAVMPGIEMLYRMTRNHEYRESACLQFINRDYFINNDLWFIPGILHEDNAFTFKAMLSSERVSHVPRVFFNRRMRGNSIVTSQVRFMHAYGQFISYLHMMDFCNTKSFSREHQTAIANVLNNVIFNVRKKYSLLPPEEIEVLSIIPPVERRLFTTMVVDAQPEPIVPEQHARFVRYCMLMEKGLRSLRHSGIKATYELTARKIKRRFEKPDKQ